MQLINLKRCYFYQPIKNKVDGEVTLTWNYISDYLLNVQQDINELDRNSAGIIDYERIKLRTDKSNLNIAKNYGVSFAELSDGDTPSYRVSSYTKVGNSSLIICETYNA